MTNKSAKVVSPEKKLIADYKRTEAEYNRLGDRVHKLFYSRAQRAYKAKDEARLRAIADKCPAHVTKVFIFDLIRQLTKGE